jgi:hypothetical protein
MKNGALPLFHAKMPTIDIIKMVPEMCRFLNPY